MHALVDELAEEITPEVAARSGISASQWQTNLDTMKSWLATRAAAIDALDPVAPVITPPGGPIAAGLEVEMAAPAGTIHYTIDGSDPRMSGGGVSPTASVYEVAFAPDGPVTITARVFSGGGWSGLTSAVFFPAEDGPRFLPGGSAAWNVDEHWESAPERYPNGPGQAATIGRPAAGNRTVTLEAPLGIGALWFDGADSPFRNRLSGASPNTLKFSSGNGNPAALRISGDGPGFVEFDVDAGVVLADDLILDVAHLTGDPGHGALRLRRDWTGPGGLIKRGAGLASLTGGGKSYTGTTRIENGVLQFTEPATPGASESVVVWPGGQMRLVSGGTREVLFGGAIELSGAGRGDEIPDGEGQGKLGALRYEPGAGENHGIITNPVVLADDTHIHVASEGNRLTLSGGISGAGRLIKSGGGTLALNGGGVHPSSLEVANGTLEARGMTGGPVVIAAGSVFDATGVVTDVSGAGVLRPAADKLAAGNVTGTAVKLLFAPGLVTFTANSLTGLERVDVFLDAPLPGPGDHLTGGIVLPTAEAWDGVDFTGMRVFTPDAVGDRDFAGRTWSPVVNATATRVPSVLAGHPGSVLELRFDGAPLDYDDWVAATFPAPEDREDPDVSGPAASPFGDGVANLLRFALGTDDQGRARLPTMGQSNDGGVFRFPYDPGLRRLRWVVEATDDLTNWSTVDVIFDSNQSEIPTGVGGWLEVTDPATDIPRRFYRLRIGIHPL
jgi:autotransporter-associated beta strand protein